jgi:hypothetical protein
MMGKRCAYLTMDDIGNFVSDADLSLAPMAELGWEVDMVAWRREVDWGDYDLVYICTPWDYQNDVAGFLHVLETIERSSATLVNSLELVLWNLEKTYLEELESRGADIVPSLYFDELRGIYEERPFFVQPFIDSVESEGEYSLFFFGGEYSHAILKKPKAGDFRTQEEHGADILAVEAPAALVETAAAVLAVISPQPVYVRADYVSASGDRFLLMELELIEPSLYFRADPPSASRFARALTRAAA